MSEPIESPFPYSVDVPGVGVCTILAPEGVPGYRVQIPSGEVQSVLARSGNPSPENAAADIANPLAPEASPTQIYAAALAAGYVDTITGLKLKTTERARSMFTSQATLIQLALGSITDPATKAGFLAAPQSIWDFNDAEQIVTTEQLIGLLLRYGQHWQTLFALYAP